VFALLAVGLCYGLLLLFTSRSSGGSTKIFIFFGAVLLLLRGIADSPFASVIV
jgi:hypothetical protein